LPRAGLEPLPGAYAHSEAAEIEALIEGSRMSQAGKALLRGVDAEAVVADLDRLRATHVVAEQWLLAVENRLGGPALYLLEDELPEQADMNRQAAALLADRVAELDGAITGDPTKLVELSKLVRSNCPPIPRTPPPSPTTRSSECAA
jgi:hypothetical protein